MVEQPTSQADPRPRETVENEGGRATGTWEVFVLGKASKFDEFGPGAMQIWEVPGSQLGSRYGSGHGQITGPNDDVCFLLPGEKAEERFQLSE